MMQAVLFVALGVAAGVLSGILGLGGGVFIVPALVMLFGFSQHMAQGTTLALMVPPVSLLAAIAYYRHGHVHLLASLLICLGFFFGSYYGARFAVITHELLLRRLFGGFLLVLSLRMLLTR